MKVRTRIAPSPTGAPHIGTAYIALFNYAFARRLGGDFILRIEDTDQARSTRESEEAILASLRWLGLSWDEGPDVGGPRGPYRQSERTAIYREQVERLLATDAVYPCFCSAERLNELRRRQMEAQGNVGYDGACAGLAPAEARARIAAGEPYVVRLRTPAEGNCVARDRLRGEIVIPWESVDDQVLLKADGFPTYHLANVVDDRLMGITHVIRGEEWISSAPKHLLLYEAFGWPAPELIHLPLLRNPDKSKLSKRRNPTSILYYRQAGYLPEAILNFLGLMAYSPADGEEVFSLERMVADFDIDRVSLGGPVFDIQKLRNFNGRYIRELGEDALYARLQEWMLNEDTWKRVLPLAKPRLSQLTDLVPMAAFLFDDRPAYEASALLDGAGAEAEEVLKRLRFAQWQIEKTRRWEAPDIHSVFGTLSERENVPMRDLMLPFYVAMAGATVALPIFESMAILGRDMCLRRIQYAVETLASAGIELRGKTLKRATSEYETRYGRAD